MDRGKSALQLLCPFGNWSHKKGMQIVDKTAAQKLRDSFMRGFDRIFGVPIYIGHPDDAGKPAKAVGRIESISVTDEGIAVCARYSESAYAKITSGKLKWLSPRWRMQALKNGAFRPVKLISVGMTDNPNIPNSGAILSSENRRLDAGSKKILELQRLSSSALKKAERLEKSSAEISEKSARLNRDFLDSQIQKNANPPDPCELASLAIARSKKTGEPYIESFCAVRRKYYGSNKK
ncbi:MAG: hypothetical protein J6P03_03010 [Opitutales bacterium]|nr:hypothetical protein [Opitutales bacterium]